MISNKYILTLLVFTGIILMFLLVLRAVKFDKKYPNPLPTGYQSSQVLEF